MRRSTVYTIILGCYMAVLAVLGGAKPLDEVEKPSHFGDFDPA